VLKRYLMPGWVSSSLPKTSMASVTLRADCQYVVRASCLKSGSLVGPVDILDGQDGEGAVVTEIAQGDTSTGLDAEVVDGLLGHVQVDGHAEEVAVDETVVLDDAIVVGLVQEAWRRSC
jgi:hypothetical protein